MFSHTTILCVSTPFVLSLKELGTNFQINRLSSLVISMITIRKIDYYREFTDKLRSDDKD